MKHMPIEVYDYDNPDNVFTEHPEFQTTNFVSMSLKRHKDIVVDEISDVDQDNPVNVSQEGWEEIYGNTEDPEGFMDHDHSMDG